MSQPSAQHITLRASSTLHRTVSQHWGTQCCVPSLLSLGYRPARTLLARLWGRLLHKGKCSAEHLPSSDATPCRCCLGVFGHFFCFLIAQRSAGLAQVAVTLLSSPLWALPACLAPPWRDTSRRTRALEQDAGRTTAATVFVSHCLSHPKVVLSLPKCREESVPGTLAQVPACHLHLTLCSPLSHGQGTPPAPSTARVGVSVPRHPPWHLPGSPFSTRFEPQLQRSRQEPKASSALFSTRNREQIC